MRERKENPTQRSKTGLFEEITVNTAEVLVQMFWVSLAVIFIGGLVWSKMERYLRH